MDNLKKYLKQILQIKPTESESFKDNEKHKRETILFDVELEKLLPEFDKAKNNILRFISENRSSNKDIIETLIITEIGEIRYILYNLTSLSNFDRDLKLFLLSWSEVFFKKVETIQNSYKHSFDKKSIIELVELVHLLEDGKKDFLTQLRKYNY